MKIEGVKTLLSLNELWFEHHKHLSNEEMLELGLVDECDLGWVQALRDKNKARALFETLYSANEVESA